MAVHLILTGFSATGKSTVGQKLAADLDRPFVDSDAEIERRAGKPIPRIFAEDGEPTFRKLESAVLAGACLGPPAVIATGGGAVLSPENRLRFRTTSFTVCLDASTETIYQRLLADTDESPNPVVRPLLAGENPRARIEFLKSERAAFYASADVTIATDGLAIDEVVAAVLAAWQARQAEEAADAEALGPPGHPSGWRAERARQPEEAAEAEAADDRLGEKSEASAPYCETSGAVCVVETPTARYPVFVGWGLLDELGRRIRNAGLADAAYLISDEAVFRHHGEQALQALQTAGLKASAYTVPPGETAKDLATASRIYEWLVEQRAERGHTIVALGGGVVGDLAGFVAATFLRGLPFVQAPTTLLAMVDASVGGKTGVNLPQGKNLVGAFYQPRLVLADVATLATLPPRELASGWAEVIKHAFILDPELLDQIEAEADTLVQLDPAAATAVIGRSMAIKARVVSEDERETGRRTLLNYGHTIAHGIEAATGYTRYLHGEAVAIGLVGAAKLAAAVGLAPADLAPRTAEILRRFGLPTRAPGIDAEAVLGAIALDKKVSRGAVRWVLLRDIGAPEITRDVPIEAVRAVLKELFL